MLNSKLLTLILSLVVFYSTHAIGSDCIKVRGAIHTTVQDPDDVSVPTLGTFSFRTKHDKKICGISGQIIGVNSLGLPELEHHVACDDHTSFITYDSVTRFKPKNECEVKIVEISEVISIHGDYEDYIGRIVTKGIINRCTGNNDFKYKGKLCDIED